MDTIGLLGAWIAVISFMIAVLVAIAVNLGLPIYQRLWIYSSRKRSEVYLQQLLLDLELRKKDPSNSYVSTLVSLYGSMSLNLIAAMGLLVISIEILDLAPAILAATLPFDINSKTLTRATGLLTLVLSYFFILRLAYLGTQIQMLDVRKLSSRIRSLQARLGSRT